MSKSIEELQKSFMESMKSMTDSFNEERKATREKIEKLERKVKHREGEIKKLEDELSEKKPPKYIELEDQLKVEIKMNDLLKEDIRKKAQEVDEEKEVNKKIREDLKVMENLIDIKGEDIKRIEKEKIELNKTIESMKRQYDELQKLYEQLQTQFIINKGQATKMQNEEIEKYSEELNKKEYIINELTKQNEKFKESNQEYLKFIKKLQDDIENNKKEHENLLFEKEQYFKSQLANKEKEQKERDEQNSHKISEIEKNLKDKENETKTKGLGDEELNKFITEILCDFLLRLNNSQYFISMFDLLEMSLLHYDDLEYFYNMDTLYNYSLNDTLFNFFVKIKSFMQVYGPNVTFNDFLAQKSFKFSEISKNEISVIKKISTIKLCKDINTLDLYRKKKEIFFKSAIYNFEQLKEKIIKNKTAENQINYMSDLFSIKKPPENLLINFSEINMFKFYPLVRYQVYNLLPKVNKLSIIINEVHLFSLYSILIHCNNLTSLTISCMPEANNEINEILVDLFNNFVMHIKNLKELDYINVPIDSKKIQKISDTLKNSSLTSLTLSNCIKNKEDLNVFTSYFSNPNSLKQIDLSNHNFNIPTLLSSSLLNLSLSHQITHITFESCNLNDEDIKIISDYIVANKILISCNIGKNNLSQLACSTFGHALNKTTSLERVNLNQCGINGEFLLFLFSAKGSQTLKYVNISYNDFGDIGLVSIGAFIKNSPNLEEIEIKSCGGSDMGFNNVINNVKNSQDSKLKKIHFEKNNISQITIQMLKGLNEIFKSKQVTFFVDFCEGEEDIDCLKFCKSLKK